MSVPVIIPYNIPTGSYTSETYTSIQNTNIAAQFDENTTIEFIAYENGSNQANFLITYDYNNYTLENNTITFNPIFDITDVFGIISGDWIVEYNIFNKKCGTDYINTLFITEISPSRTELRLDSTAIDDFLLSDKTLQYIQEREQSNYFKDFLLNFGNNNLFVGVNLALDTTTSNTQILVKLRDPLPASYVINNECTIVERINFPIKYGLRFPITVLEPLNTGIPLQGPNLNLIDFDEINTGTPYQNQQTLTQTNLSSSLYNINNILSGSSIRINVDYNDYNDFIFFSSAVERLENFYYKMSLLESYNNSLTQSLNFSNNTSANTQIYRDRINDLVSNFTEYENFLYYESGSNSWPKTNTTPPYQRYSTGSLEVLQWIGSLNEQSSNYGGLLLSASLFDNENRNNLQFSIPEFIRLDPENEQYDRFIAMIGEHFDNIWIYTKDITNKFNGDNRINVGISRDLVSDAIKDFGIKLYQNNYSIYDVYTAFLGITPSGSLNGLPNIISSLSLFYNSGLWGGNLYGPPPPGAQYVTEIITASNDIVPLDDINKTVYKRIYHNAPYLLKSKGTKAGLKSLISLYGIPDTILTVNEFGGKDKMGENDWDFYRRIYNKEISTGLFFEQNYSQTGLYAVGTYSQSVYHGTITGSYGAPLDNPFYDGVVIPKGWELHPSWSINPSVPRSVEFRFKSILDPDTLPLNPDIRQCLFFKGPTTDTNEVAIVLEYNGSGSYSGSYSGSIVDPLNKVADLTFYISGSSQIFSSSISDLPLLNKDWWNVMLNYTSESNTFELYAGNKIYNGDNGTKIGFVGSSSLTLPTYVDTKAYRDNNIGVFNTFTTFSIDNKDITKFSGSFQEIRYWSTVLNEPAWENHVMNPLSIEGNILTGSDSTRNTLAFRTREGEDLDVSLYDIIASDIISIHPKITGSSPELITASFGDYAQPGTSSYAIWSGSFGENSEFQFLNQPIAGLKNRVSDRIRVENLEFPSGNALSFYRTLQQNSMPSKSYTEGINYIEVGFSPSNQINDDIISELGGFDLAKFIADPRLRKNNENNYPELNRLRDQFFEKYIKNYNVLDFVNLIKYFDNSLFKMIKDFIPARNTAATGVIIKQHLLERQKYPQPEMTFTNVEYTGSVKSQPKGFTTGSSIQIFNGGTGGSLEVFNGLTNKFNITQSYSQSNVTPSGSIITIHNTQDEFYNGEFSGSNITVTTQSLNPGCGPYLNIDFTAPPTSNFNTYVYRDSTSIAFSLATNLDKFLEGTTSPNEGEIYLFESNNLVTLLKVSTINNDGINIFNTINNATNFTFNFEGTQYNIDVNQEFLGSDYICFSLPVPLNISLTENNFDELSFRAQKPGIISDFSLAINEDLTTIATQTDTIENYSTETDPNNLFDLISGEYTTPYTPNRQITITGSVDFTVQSIVHPVLNPLGGANDGAFKVKLELDYTPNAQTPSPAIGQLEDTFIFDSGIAGPVTRAGTLLFSASFNPSVPIERSKLKLRITGECDRPDSPTLFKFTFENADFQINTPPVTDTNPVSSLLFYQPYFPNAANFINALDCQPLLNNAVDIRPGTLYYDVDYSKNIISPTNLVPILSYDQQLDPALIPDSNYSSKTWTGVRYEGVKLSSAKYSKYTGNQTLPDGTLWQGDISYGKTAVIDKESAFFGYFRVLLPTSPELEFHTQANIYYIIDKNGDPVFPQPNTPGFYNVEGTFEAGNEVDIALIDSFQKNDDGTFSIGGSTGTNINAFNSTVPVKRGARRVDSILTTQTQSILETNTPDQAFTNGSLFFFSEKILQTDFSFQAGLFSQVDYDGPVTINAQTSVEFIVSASNIGYDYASNYNTGTSIWTNSPINVNDFTPMSFEFVGNISARENVNLMTLSIIKKRGTAKISLRTLTFPQPTIGQDFYVTNPSDPGYQGYSLFTDDITDLEVGDEVFVELKVFYGGVDIPGQGTVPLGSKVRIFNSNFYGRPSDRFVVEASASHWSTGSAHNNYLTASVDLSSFYGYKQEVPTGSTFKPNNEDFTIKIGDEFRFMGSENRVHTVGNIHYSASRVIAEVSPSVPPTYNLDQFLLRRYNKDGTSVLLDLNPPKVGFGSGAGFLKNTNPELSSEILDNIDTITTELITKRIIS